MLPSSCPCPGCCAPLWACQDLTLTAHARDQGIQLYTHPLRKAWQYRGAPWQHGVTHCVPPGTSCTFWGLCGEGCCHVERSCALGCGSSQHPDFFSQNGLWSQLAKEGGVWGARGCVQVLPCLSVLLRCAPRGGLLFPCPLGPAYTVTPSFTPALLFLSEWRGSAMSAWGERARNQPTACLAGGGSLEGAAWTRGVVQALSTPSLVQEPSASRAACAMGWNPPCWVYLRAGLFQMQLCSPRAEPEASDTSSPLPCRGMRPPRRWSSS